jgi:hypothetical protein
MTSVMTIEEAIRFLEDERLSREGRAAVRVLRMAVEAIHAGKPAVEISVRSFRLDEHVPAPLRTQNRVDEG